MRGLAPFHSALLSVLHLRAAFDLPLIRMHAQRERHLTAAGDGRRHAIADESNPFNASEPFPPFVVDSSRGARSRTKVLSPSGRSPIENRGSDLAN